MADPDPLNKHMAEQNINRILQYCLGGIKKCI